MLRSTWSQQISYRKLCGLFTMTGALPQADGQPFGGESWCMLKTTVIVVIWAVRQIYERVIYKKSGPSKDKNQYTTKREQAHDSGLSKASGPPLETAIQTEDNRRRLLSIPERYREFDGACRRKGLGQGPMAHICGYSACRGRRAS